MVHGHLQNFKSLLSDGRHEFCADLAAELGGEDTGPNPHEMLEAALAACTLQTMQLYAIRKGWDIQQTKVGVKILSEGTEVEIGRTLSFDPHLTEEQRTKLSLIADKCPVHKILQANVRIVTEQV